MQQRGDRRKALNLRAGRTNAWPTARSGQGHNQTVVQALLVLPMIVAGIVLVVSNSLALAFSLGGVVAASLWVSALAFLAAMILSLVRRAASPSPTPVP